jgi:hypothetical protein
MKLKETIHAWLDKISKYPRWAVFNIVCFTLIAICIIVSAPLFTAVWKPMNEADVSRSLSNVTDDAVNQYLPPVERATQDQRVEVNIVTTSFTTYCPTFKL